MASSVKDIHICVVGCGMGGLATALALARHGFTHVEVIENAPALGFVGAGIQLAPNMAKILDKLGVWANIAKEATNIKQASVRQGSTNEELARVDMTWVENQFGFPHMVGHRASLAGEMYEGCKRESNSIKFIFNTTLKGVESFGPKPVLVLETRGEPVYKKECDVLLAADGVKSVVRDQMMTELNLPVEIAESHQAAYRILLTREQVADDPELLALLDADEVTRWIGERKHIIAYPVHNKSIYNISTAHPDTHFASAPTANYTTFGSKDDMREVFSDFSPLIHRMIDLVPEGEVCEWRLRVHGPLQTWIHGTTALVGDACHPTLPHMNQGAAQAIEDGAVLGVVLGRLTDASPESIHKALQVYEDVRKARAERLVELAAANGRAMQLSKKEAEERDKQFATLRATGGVGTVPDKTVDREVQAVVYGFDAMDEADKRFDELYSTL